MNRTITMTIYAIEAQLLDATTWGDPPNSRFLIGYVTVRAQGTGERHSWQIRPDQRCWIGDSVTVTIFDDEPNLTPPPIDKRST